MIRNSQRLELFHFLFLKTLFKT